MSCTAEDLPGVQMLQEHRRLQNAQRQASSEKQRRVAQQAAALATAAAAKKLKNSHEKAEGELARQAAQKVWTRRSSFTLSLPVVIRGTIYYRLVSLTILHL